MAGQVKETFTHVRREMLLESVQVEKLVAEAYLLDSQLGVDLLDLLLRLGDL